MISLAPSILKRAKTSLVSLGDKDLKNILRFVKTQNPIVDI